ncbi:MAG TPA: carboxymuconolactone decarboxylase family protein [Streptosporangiaceae bacterium]|nr:carboxymuconolactone decarboxylase family protein [Streptosporangiaceae bacterium]
MSDSTITAQVWELPGRLWQLRPEACGLLTALNERVWQAGDPVLLELVRVRVAQLIGNPVPVRARAPASPAEQDVVDLTEQFVIDVGGTTKEMRAGLTARFGADGARDLVTAVYVVEFTQRLQLIAARLLGDAVAVADSVAVTGLSAAAGVLAAAGLSAAADASPAGLLDAYQAAVVRGSTLDAVTTELVRLRCARTHHCRICQTLRLADARAAGVDETMTAKVDFYERSDLPERAKLALRVTDAFITRPDLLSDAMAGQARASFGPDELASLSLDITKWSTQKIKVTLGTDGADRLVTDADGVALFGFDPEGQAAGFRRRP